jgi:hypothetical protein
MQMRSMVVQTKNLFYSCRLEFPFSVLILKLQTPTMAKLSSAPLTPKQCLSKLTTFSEIVHEVPCHSQWAEID